MEHFLGESPLDKCKFIQSVIFHSIFSILRDDCRMNFYQFCVIESISVECQICYKKISAFKCENDK